MTGSRPECYVVLTAAVTPNVSGRVFVQDPVVRQQQYKEAIVAWRRFTQKHASLKMLVVETTGYGASRLISESLGAPDSTVVALDFSPTVLELARGKGSVEAAALDLVTTQALRENDRLIKVTGRLQLQNASNVLSPETLSRPFTCRMVYGVPFVDTRIFVASREVWTNYFFGMRDEVDDSKGCYLEHVMGRRALMYAASRGYPRRFAAPPRWVGQSGSMGVTYSRRWPATLESLTETLLWHLYARKAL